ncbi:MAG: GerW family sporulation protein [Caldicoprobacterales bacterium]|nr:sporulation protein YtfJ [Clostridiales bacterium]
MSEHPIENVMKTTMENLKEMIDVNTIVGDAVETAEGTVIVPISKVSFGFIAGGGEYKEEGASKKAFGNGSGNSNGSADGEAKEMPFAGGSGAGVSVNPIAFLVVGEDKIKLLPVQYNSTVDRIVELVPSVVGELQNMIGKGQNKAKDKKTETIITNVPQQ